MASTDSYPLRCRCGQVHGRVETRGTAMHGRCFCRYCQAYARFLGRPEETLDDRGGTELMIGMPDAVHLDAGHDRLASVTLSERGPLRWYATCCNTPIGNTLRTIGLPYVGLVADCLPGTPAERAAAFGPERVAVNTASARGEPKPAATPLAVAAGGAGMLGRMAVSRLTGRYRQTPFFTRTGQTVSAPRALTAAEKAGLGLEPVPASAPSSAPGA